MVSLRGGFEHRILAGSIPAAHFQPSQRIRRTAIQAKANSDTTDKTLLYAVEGP